MAKQKTKLETEIGEREKRLRDTRTGPQCPKCGHERSYVIDSRITNHNATRRRRICGDCRFRFTTYEVSEAQWEVVDTLPHTVAEAIVWVDHLLRRLRVFEKTVGGGK